MWVLRGRGFVLYSNPGEARASLDVFRQRYNDVRPLWALVPSGQRDPLTMCTCMEEPVELPKWQAWAKAAKEKLKKMAEGAHLPSSVAPAAEAVAGYR